MMRRDIDPAEMARIFLRDAPVVFFPDQLEEGYDRALSEINRTRSVYGLAPFQPPETFKEEFIDLVKRTSRTIMEDMR